jgi:hypothetical protein
MILRTARCGDSLHAHPPHPFTEYEWGSSSAGFEVACGGWTDAEASASAIAAAVQLWAGRDAAARLLFGPAAAWALSRILRPSLSDITGAGCGELGGAVLGGTLDALYGVPAVLEETGTAWRLTGADGGVLAAGDAGPSVEAPASTGHRERAAPLFQ